MFSKYTISKYTYTENCNLAEVSLLLSKNPKQNTGSTKMVALWHTLQNVLQMLFAPFPTIYDASLEAIFFSKLDILVHL